MALVSCPECGSQVSDKAKTCIHCGAPLEEEKNIVKIKTPNGDGVILRVTYTVYNDKTNKILATAGNGEVMIFELNEATTTRLHLGRGYKDALIRYVPSGTKRYSIKLINTFFGAHLSIQEVDTIDSDV